MKPNIPISAEIPQTAVPEKTPPKVFVTRTLIEGEIPTWGDVKAADSVLAQVQAEAVRLNSPISETGEPNA